MPRFRWNFTSLSRDRVASVPGLPFNEGSFLAFVSFALKLAKRIARLPLDDYTIRPLSGVFYVQQ